MQDDLLLTIQWYSNIPPDYSIFPLCLALMLFCRANCICCPSTIYLALKALPLQWVALDTAILQSLRSRMSTSVSPFFFMSLLMVSIYLSFGLPLSLTPSTSMSSTVLVIWLSSLRPTCPYQRSRFCIGCVVIG